MRSWTAFIIIVSLYLSTQVAPAWLVIDPPEFKAWEYDSSIPDLQAFTVNAAGTSIRQFQVLPENVGNYEVLVVLDTSGYPTTPPDRPLAIPDTVAIGPTYYFRAFLVDYASKKRSAGVTDFCRPNNMTGVPDTPSNLRTLGLAQGQQGPQRPIFVWQATGQNAAWFQIWITRDNQKYMSKWVNTKGWQADHAFPEGSYNVYVRGWNQAGYGKWTQARSFTILTLRPLGPPVLTSPSDGGRLNKSATSAVFSWDSRSDTSWYRLYVNRNGTKFADHWTQDTSVTLPVTAGNYDCWMQGANPHGMSKWSPGKSFTHLLPGQSQVSRTPKDSLNGETRPTLSAKLAAEATWYQLYIARSGQHYLTKWLQPSPVTWTPDHDLPAGRYLAWVQTWNQHGFGKWSGPNSFTVTPPIVGTWLDVRYPPSKTNDRNTLVFDWGGSHPHELFGRGRVYQKIGGYARTIPYSWIQYGDQIHITYDYVGYYMGVPTYIRRLDRTHLTTNTPDGSYMGLTAEYYRNGFFGID